MQRLGDLVAPFDPIGLDELDERAALQRRTDNKYLVPWALFGRLTGALCEDHVALEIEGRRSFAYESAYLDTPALTCFHDHVEGRSPRFKIRTRLYVDTGACSFEIKVKRENGDTDKASLDHAERDHGRITPRARRFLDETVRAATGRPAPAELDRTLTTSFHRATLAARDGAERVTCDDTLRLRTADGRAAVLRDDDVLLETKTAEGDGRCDRLLRAAGLEPISLSKYRVGIGVLVAGDVERGFEEMLRVQQ